MCDSYSFSFMSRLPNTKLEEMGAGAKVGGANQSNQSNFIMKCDKRTQNIESSVRMTVQKNIKKQNT